MDEHVETSLTKTKEPDQEQAQLPKKTEIRPYRRDAFLKVLTRSETWGEALITDLQRGGTRRVRARLLDIAIRAAQMGWEPQWIDQELGGAEQWLYTIQLEWDAKYGNRMTEEMQWLSQTYIQMEIMRKPFAEACPICNEVHARFKNTCELAQTAFKDDVQFLPWECACTENKMNDITEEWVRISEIGRIAPMDGSAVKPRSELIGVGWRRLGECTVCGMKRPEGERHPFFKAKRAAESYLGLRKCESLRATTFARELLREPQ